jgi:type II secretory pathway component PulF
MPQYTYIALDAGGAAASGVVEAGDRAAALAQLMQRELFVTDLGEQAPPRSAWGSLPRWGGSVRPRAKAAMMRQLATALEAGLPLLTALRTVQDQSPPGALRDLAADLASRVQHGQSISEAMAAHPRVFSKLESSMTRVGETAGKLDEVMAYLADFCERDLEVREQVRSAATYPVFVLSLALVSVVVIVTVILPRVVGAVAEGTGAAALPAPTRLLLGLSGLLTHWGWLMALVAVAAGAGLRRWSRTPGGRLALDRLKLRLPLYGPAVRRVAVARFTRTLGTLSRSGVHILEALGVLRDTLGNEALAREIDKVAAEITQGQSIAEPLRKTGQFPPLLTQVIAMGEKTGRLDELLLRAAATYEKETAVAIGRVMSILPAALIVLLACVVAFILASVLLPIIEMQTSVGM